MYVAQGCWVKGRCLDDSQMLFFFNQRLQKLIFVKYMNTSHQNKVLPKARL